MFTRSERPIRLASRILKKRRRWRNASHRTRTVSYTHLYYYLMLKFKGFHIEAVEHSYRALELCGGAKREARPETRRMCHA